MRLRLFGAASAAALLLAAPIAAQAGPISGYPAASALTGTEGLIGTQASTTVQVTPIQIQTYITSGPITWGGVQTFPAPGAGKGSIVLTPGTATGTPPNGSLWTTSASLDVQIAGATQQIVTTGATGQIVTNVTAAPGVDFNSTGADFGQIGNSSASSSNQWALGFGGSASAFGTIAAHWGQRTGGVTLFTADNELNAKGTINVDSGSLSLCALAQTTEGPCSNGGLSFTTLNLPGFGEQITGSPVTGLGGSALFSYDLAITNSSGAQLATVWDGGGGGSNLGTIRIQSEQQFLGAMSQGSQIVFTDNVVPANSVIGVTVTAAGTGYTSVPTITFSGGCTAHFLAFINASGGLGRVEPYTSGSGTCPAGTTATVTGGGGTGATVSLTLNSTSPGQPGPDAVWTMSTGNNLGFGFAANSSSLADNVVRFGSVSNFAQPWDNYGPDQDDFGLIAGIQFGQGTGTNVSPESGGATYYERLVGQANVLDLAGPANGGGTLGTHNVGLQTAFVRFIPVTVAGLATADPTPADGDSAYVTDATSCSTLNGSLTGGGSTHCRVHYDGSGTPAWKIG